MIRGHKTRDHMETLPTDILALLDAFEEEMDSDALAFDADDMLDDEA